MPIKCADDERTCSYKGKVKVMGRIAGQMLSLIDALLKNDQEVLRNTSVSQTPPELLVYDPAVNKAHREGQYRALKPKTQAAKIIQLPKR